MRKRIIMYPIIFVLMFSIFSNFSFSQAEIKNDDKKTNSDTVENIYNSKKEKKLPGPRVDGLLDAATSGSLMDYPGIIKINETTGESSGKVPGEYANLLMFSSESKYTVVGAKSTTTAKTIFNETTTEANGGEHYVKISNVGFYQGTKIDLKINLESIYGAGQLTVWTPTTVGNEDFLRMQVKGKDRLLKIRYDFLDNETGEKVPYKGSWIVKRLNDYKTLKIDSTSDHLAGIFAFDTAGVINYSTNDNFKTTEFVGTNGNTGIDLKKNQMMYAFNAPTGSAVQEYIPSGGGDRNVYYESKSIAQMELPYPSLFGLKNESYPKVSYDIQQDYPSQAKAQFYPTSYTVTAKLDKVVDMNKLSLKVTDLNEKDVSGNFSMTKDASTHTVKISINSSSLNSEAFANNSYKMHLESEMDSSISPEEYYEEDGYYHIPASITMKTNLNESPEQTDEALTKAPVKGTVVTKYVEEDEKTEITTSETQTGIVGENYTVEKKDVNGYEFVKSVGNMTGKFTEGSQTVLMVYKKTKGTVTTKYVLEDEKTEITDAVTQTGNIGDNYTIEQKEIKGYEFVKAVGNTTGQFTEKSETVLMVYKKAKGTVTTKYVLEDEKTEITDAVTQTGEIGANYTAEQKEIKGYEFVKVIGNATGQFTEQPQTVLMVYSKINNNIAPKITLDQESSEPVNNTGDDFKISGQVTDEDSEEVTVFYKVDSGEAKKVETFKQPDDKNQPFDYSGVVPKEMLNDGKEHTIEVYAIDSDEAKSSETPKVTLLPFTGTLEFVTAPEDISFGEDLAISTKLQNYFVQNKTNDLVVQDKRSNPGFWRMSASLENSLTSESGKKIENAVRYGDQVIEVGQSIQVFDQKQPNNNEVNLSEDWIEKQQGLNLVIPAGKVKAESYSTEIIWSLESVPGNE